MDLDGENQNLIGVFTTDENFIVQVWDAALEQMTGISAAEARGRSVVETIPDLERRGLLQRFQRVLADGTVEILAPAFHRFLIACPPQFAARHFAEMRQRVTIAPLRKNEQLRGLIVTIEDVTARMEQEIELARRLENADDTVRLQTAKALSHEPENLGEENAAPIIEALGDKNWRVRRELVESLARRAAPDAIAALLRAMQEKHFDFSVLNSALQVLQATSVKTTETLIEFLKGDDADLRMQAALTLGEQKDAQAASALLEALRDENVNVRYHAIEALGKLQTAEAVEPLLAIAEARDFFLSFAALDALREIADEATAGRILPLLSDDDFLREAVIETLGAVSSEEVVPPLINLLNDEPHAAPTVARALDVLFDRFEGDPAKSDLIIEHARKAISESGKNNLLAALGGVNETDLIPLIRLGGWFENEKVAGQLAELLEDEALRLEAMRALVRHGSSAVDLLIQGLDDEDSETRPTKALALGQIGDPRAFEPLVELLTGDNALFRLAAVEALKSLAHPETVGRLCDLLTGEDAAIREKAIQITGYFGAKGCEDKIFDCCADPDERVRRAAVEQLPNIADERSLPTLIRALQDDSSRVRETAAKALAKIKSDESINALRTALGDADSWTRYFAVRALGALRDSASREILLEMAESDAAEHVRAAAREVLGELND